MDRYWIRYIHAVVVSLALALPLAWPGVLTGLVLTFAHTLGEFGVVLMVGGNIPGETRTEALLRAETLRIPAPDAGVPVEHA